MRCHRNRGPETKKGSELASKPILPGARAECKRTTGLRSKENTRGNTPPVFYYSLKLHTYPPPGDPVVRMIGEGVSISPELYNKIKVEMGLDRPTYEQLAVYLQRVIRGDLGFVRPTAFFS